MALPKFKKIDRSLEEQIKEVVKNIALSTDGVSSLPQKCIVIENNQDGLEIDLNLLVRFGSRIPVVAWDTQEKVMKALSGFKDIRVKKVNVNIQGVE